MLLIRVKAIHYDIDDDYYVDIDIDITTIAATLRCYDVDGARRAR